MEFFSRPTKFNFKYSGKKTIKTKLKFLPKFDKDSFIDNELLPVTTSERSWPHRTLATAL